MNLGITERSLEKILAANFRLLRFSELRSVRQKREVCFPIGPAYSRWERLQYASCRGGTHIRGPPPKTLVLSCRAAHERVVHDA